jgi:hypothetical protein
MHHIKKNTEGKLMEKIANKVKTTFKNYRNEANVIIAIKKGKLLHSK